MATTRSNPSQDGPRAHSIDVAIGFVKMSGGTEVICSLQQIPGTDHAILNLSVIADCKSDSPLDLVIDAAGKSHPGSVDVALGEREEKTFRSFPFTPLPPAGTLVRATITAPCSGASHESAWGTGRCIAPGPRPSPRPRNEGSDAKP